MSLADPPVRAVALPTGVTLHGIELGAGDPLVFVHGGGRDYRYWRNQVGPFAERFHVFAFSRRYAWPNDNAPLVSDYSARTDALDLAALCDTLGITRAHFIGASVGGFGALVLATQRPDLVRSLVLAEPPIMRWANDLPGGREALRAFNEGAFFPAAVAFRAGDNVRAMELLTDGFLGAGTFAQFKESRRQRVLEGARDWEAQATSSDNFTDLSRDLVRALRVPSLLLSGSASVTAHRLVDEELARVLPGARRLVIAGASHDVWLDAPKRCRDESLAFLAAL